MKKLIGKVSSEERDEIKKLFERKNGLSELVKIIGNNDALYERLVNDMGKTMSDFQAWWDRMSQKYKWESTPNGNWTIDFESCNIYLEG